MFGPTSIYADTDFYTMLPIRNKSSKKKKKKHRPHAELTMAFMSCFQWSKQQLLYPDEGIVTSAMLISRFSKEHMTFF